MKVKIQTSPPKADPPPAENIELQNKSNPLNPNLFWFEVKDVLYLPKVLEEILYE